MTSREAGAVASDEAGAVVLLVDDEPDVVSVTAVHLERHLDGVAVVTETSGGDALARFDDDVDCVVSDYEMPDVDGLELLHRIRDLDPDLPFILFTARGSEEIASEAISAGVTDYLQKSIGTDQYTVLANRIENAIERRRSQAAAAETRSRYRQVVERSPNAILVHDGSETLYANDRAADLIGAHQPETLYGREPLSWFHPEDRSFARERIERIVEDREPTTWATHRIVREDGAVRTVDVCGAPVRYRGIDASQVVMRDVTDRLRHERRLEALHDATRDLATARDVREVADISLSALAEVLEDPVASMWRYDPEEDALVAVAATDVCRGRTPDHEGSGPLPPLSDVVEMDVFHEGESRVIQAYGGREDAAAGRFETGFLVPLDDHGILRVASLESREFTDSERDLIGILARSVTPTLDRVTSEDNA